MPKKRKANHVFGINQALQHLNKGCEDDYPSACVNLGDIYRQGDYVTQSKSKAKKFYKKGCDLGFDLGCELYRDLNE